MLGIVVGTPCVHSHLCLTNGQPNRSRPRANVANSPETDRNSHPRHCDRRRRLASRRPRCQVGRYPNGPDHGRLCGWDRRPVAADLLGCDPHHDEATLQNTVPDHSYPPPLAVTEKLTMTRPHNIEEGMQSPPMMHIDPQSPFLLPPTLGRVANAQSPLLPEVPRIKKAVTSERHSRTPYNFYISDALAKRCSSIHPGTKVLFGNASRLKEVPARKPVPSRHTVPSRAGTERTESLWSDEGDDDASTVLGDDGRPQRKMVADVFRPLPPGRTIVSWLAGSKGSGSAKNGG